MTIDRRDFLKLGAAGLMAGSVAGTLGSGAAHAAVQSFTLGIVDVSVELIDGTPVRMLAFSGASAGPKVPGPLLRVTEGDQVSITVVNTRRETHGFEITGIPESRTTIDGFGGSRTISFVAPAAGTYLYHDSLDGSPLYRLLGLHGVLIVQPASGMTASGVRTPYSLDRLGPQQRATMTAVFESMGTTDRFLGGEGGRWVPAPAGSEFGNQEKIWILNQVDPRFNALLVPGQPIRSDVSLTRDVVSQWRPSYFTINNRSGFDLGEGDDVVARNYIGEPTLFRVVNAGLCTHSNHIHGNHILELSEADLDPASPTVGAVKVRSIVMERDVWPMKPLQRKDVLLPYEIPPDIPGVAAGATSQENQFYRMTQGRTQERFPLKYVMHCHTEMSNTAGGGNYPQGMVTHWEISGGLGGRARTASL